MMNKKEESKNLKGIIATLAIILITAGAFYFVFFMNQTSTVNSIVWVCWFVACFVLSLLTIKGQEFIIFAKNAKIELQKVVWPNRQETVQTTSIVMIMVAITGIVLWGIDSGMMWVIGKITHLG